MGFDVGEWTPRVLEDGLLPLPDRLEPSRTIAIALWRGERHGAVVFIRLWRDGETIDYDCAITARAADGSWDEPTAWGGGPWMPDPLIRRADGWDGDQVVWLGVSAELTPLEEPGNWDPDHRDPDEYVVRAILGAASRQVGAIGVEHGGRSWTVPIESPCGAFIVGIEGPGVATLQPLDADGRPVGPTRTG